MKERTSKAELFTAFSIGALFGFGLILSGMTQPSKVVGFLDFFGNWDPSLALVMAGAIGVHVLGRALAKRFSSPVLGGHFRSPEHERLDARLLVGSVLFGAGWGLGGVCPGPALTALAGAGWPMALFVAAMIVGMLGFEGFNKLTAKP